MLLQVSNLDDTNASIHDYQGIAILEFPTSGVAPERGDKDKTSGVSRSTWPAAVYRGARTTRGKTRKWRFIGFPETKICGKSGSRRSDVIQDGILR